MNTQQPTLDTAIRVAGLAEAAGIVNGLLPELRTRGIVAPAGYQGGTLRAALGLDVAA
jgi:hypothetical protein